MHRHYIIISNGKPFYKYISFMMEKITKSEPHGLDVFYEISRISCSLLYIPLLYKYIYIVYLISMKIEIPFHFINATFNIISVHSVPGVVNRTRTPSV